MAGMRAVAQRAEVSLSTVSAVLGSGTNKYVSEEVRSWAIHLRQKQNPEQKP